MRQVTVILLLAVGLSACREAPAAPPASVDRLGAYAALLSHLASLEGGSVDTLFVRSQICATAADPTAGKNERCDDRFSADERDALTGRLSSFGDVVFVKDFDAIPKGRSPVDRSGSEFVWVGPLKAHGDRWWAGGGVTCGGLCGRGGTYVLVRDDQGWHVQGNAPGTSTWIA